MRCLQAGTKNASARAPKAGSQQLLGPGLGPKPGDSGVAERSSRALAGRHGVGPTRFLVCTVRPVNFFGLLLRD